MIKHRGHWWRSTCRWKQQHWFITFTHLANVMLTNIHNSHFIMLMLAMVPEVTLNIYNHPPKRLLLYLLGWPCRCC